MAKKGNKRTHSEMAPRNNGTENQELGDEIHKVKKPVVEKTKLSKNNKVAKKSNKRTHSEVAPRNTATENQELGDEIHKVKKPVVEKTKLSKNNKLVKKSNKRTHSEVASHSTENQELEEVVKPVAKKAKLSKIKTPEKIQPVVTKKVVKNVASAVSKKNDNQKEISPKKNKKTFKRLAKKQKKKDLDESSEVKEEDVVVKTHAEKAKWINKQRVMVLCTRGIAFRHRHLMEDLKTLMPHHKREPKLERTTNLNVLNEMSEIKNCNKVLLFEGRKKTDLYMWLANIANGPSAKFLVENVHTMAELKLTGNCLRGSRPLLSFDTTFNEHPHYKLLKELMVQVFGVPKHHPKSQPFFDHVYTFSILDNRIWFRNFQILSEEGALAEIGPRFVLNPIKIFSGSFGGMALWENPKYITPARLRREFVLAKKRDLYMNKQDQKENRENRKIEKTYDLNPLNNIFNEN